MKRNNKYFVYACSGMLNRMQVYVAFLRTTYNAHKLKLIAKRANEKRWSKRT